MNHSFPRPVWHAMALRELHQRLGGAGALRGDPDTPVYSVASPADAQAGSLVFCRADTPEQLAARLAATAASVVVLPFDVPGATAQALVVTDDPLAWFIRAAGLLFGLQQGRTAPPSTAISPDLQRGHGVQIGPGTVIESGCRIGDHSVIGPNCYLGPGTVIGDNVFIQNNVSIGGVGLGYHLTAQGERLFFPHLGAALVGDDAVVGTGSVIVRGQLDDTVVGARCRLGNLVNVGHNVKIGDDGAISSSTCIAGGAVIGARCNIGIGVAVNAKVRIGDDCQVGLGSAVTRSVADGVSVFGNPAKPLPTMGRF